MADDERAAKAARAKALLKSHQKKKKAGTSEKSNLSHLAGTSSQGPASVVSAQSPPASEAPIPDDRSEFGVSESLPAHSKPANHEPPAAVTPPSVKSPPPRRESPAPSALTVPSSPSIATSPRPAVNGSSRHSVSTSNGTASPAPSEPKVDVAALHTTIQNQQQTIAFLVSEKNNLTASLEQLEGIEQRSQQSDRLLEEGRQLVENLTNRVAELERDYSDASSKVSTLSARERDLSERASITERDLELTKRSASDLKVQLTQQRNRVRQLEEQIESDDRAEQMEKSLKGVQDRAESLEFQLSKVKQAHTQTKAERDSLEERLSKHGAVEAEWQEKYDALSAQHDLAQESLKIAEKERNDILAGFTKLQNQHQTSQQSLTTIQQRLKQLTSDHQTSSRHLSAAQSELASANKRTTQAEEALKGLQKENVELMESLGEMRAKIVELNGDKVELAERVESLERAVRSRDESIASLESSVDQAEAKISDLEEEKTSIQKQLQKEMERLTVNSNEQQQAYAAIQAELTESQAVVRELTAERAAARQSVAQLQAEAERLRVAQTTLESERATLRAELNDRTQGGDEVSDMLHATREEIESLRTELSLKEEELLRSRAQVDEANIRASTTNSPRIRSSSMSLNEEMLEAAHQQQALTLSTAQSQIRTLETSLHQEQAKTHALQRRITALEDDLHVAEMQKSILTPARLQSPRPASSLRHVLSPPLPPPPRQKIDADLSPEARHKRKISLSMLKARIDSEMSLRQPLASRPNGRLAEVEEETVKPHRPQFGDESHVFCCASCQGDLVVL